MSPTPSRIIITALAFGLLTVSASAQQVSPPPAGTVLNTNPGKITKTNKGTSVWIHPGSIPDNSAIGSIPHKPDLGIWPPPKPPGNPPGNPPANPPANPVNPPCHPGKGSSGGTKGHDHDHLTGSLIFQGLGLLGQLLSQGSPAPQQSFDPAHAHGPSPSDSQTVILRQRARKILEQIDALDRAQSELRALQHYYRKAISVAESREPETQLARGHLRREFEDFLNRSFVTGGERVFMLNDLDRMTRDVERARERYLQAREQEVEISIQRSSLERELDHVLDLL